MQARGPLMIEHRLIERVIKLIGQSSAAIKSGGAIAPATIDTYVDFIHTYADRTHHGKEEEILFRQLADRALNEADRALMDELIAEHVFGREITGKLVAANERYRLGDTRTLVEIADCLATLADFYPRHIDKEDKIFFPAVRAYFSEAEDQAMLTEFYDFDRKMIHEVYLAQVLRLEKS
jgi:hemerythrin-like domain-containing protein